MMPTRTGTSAPVSNEESLVITKIQNGTTVKDADLSPRDIALADRLVARGIIDRKVTTKATFYYMTKGGPR